jgi:acetaldehyde dehydrogenase (acetylating)
MEKLCPVLSFYMVRDWREGCERCKQILRYGGMGHTMSIHSQNEAVILEFGLKKPAFRIVVNTPTTFGSIGLTTGLDPAMTLGCGGYGGNITSDNISPRHLLNIKRLAYEVSPEANRFETASAAVQDGGITAEALSLKIDDFLGSRGYREDSPAGNRAIPPGREIASGSSTGQTVLDFVCEEDVRRAIEGGTKLALSERAIVTPAARDLGEAHRVFTVAPWRSP